MNFPVNPIFEELKAISEPGFDYLELTILKRRLATYLWMSLMAHCDLKYISNPTPQSLQPP